jgi:GNAT superfamily N-acetyltransferase
MAANDAGSDNLTFIDPGSGFEIRPLPASRDAEASEILTAATGDGTPEAARAVLDEIRAGGEDRVFGGLLKGDLVGVYGLRRDGMANEVAIIAVAEGQRRRGIGRLLLQDALRRSGKRPLVAETDDEGLGFYKACGFKLVGRRTHPSGTFRYRVGWHAPGLRFKGGSTGSVTHQPVKPEESDM